MVDRRATPTVHSARSKQGTRGHLLVLALPLIYLALSSLNLPLCHKLAPSNGAPSHGVAKPSAPLSNIPPFEKYSPSTCEKFVVENAEMLGYAKGQDSSEENPITCPLWENPVLTPDDCDMQSYAANIDKYNVAVQLFRPIPDVFDSIRRGNYSVCSSARLHEDGLPAIFSKDQLSLSSSGYIEPLLPPLRHYKYCTEGKYQVSLDYLVHDFEAMCYQLKPTSRRVLIDMGASLSYHGAKQPIVQLMEICEKFGFHFDHIYGFELKFTEPGEVYKKLLPEKYFASFHWINTGVSNEPGSKMNPLNSILRHFDEDDFIVVKLDIDTPSIEVPLAHQVLGGGKDGLYHKLIDQFYFEYHVHIAEMNGTWLRMNGTIKESLDLFYGLRTKGIPAHFWP